MHEYKKNIVKIITIIVLVLVVISLVVGIANYTALETQVTYYIKSYSMASIFILSLLIELIPQSFLAPTILIISAALLKLSLIPVIIIIMMGSIIGSALGFELGRYYGVKFVKDISVSEKRKKIKEAMNKRGKWAVTLAAISPIPYIPLIIGSLDMSRKNFFLFGIIPRALSLIVDALVIYWIL
ncbi:MAG: VTT domain-containing protein [Nanoarchaeota archaeon]|nr:VTT domain-containing protein [Nanoarchaeota archaeon]